MRGNEYQRATGSVPGLQSKAHPRGWRPSTNVHPEKGLPGHVGGRAIPLGLGVALCSLLRDPAALGAFPVAPLPPPLGSWHGRKASP